MSRPVTLVSGQWADLSFEEICAKAAAFGFDGLEIASWGDHMDLRAAAADPSYAAAKKAVLARHGLRAWALQAHLQGQCVADPWDPRLDGFAPPEAKGRPEAIRAWAAAEMLAAPRAAKAMGCQVVTAFMGSPIWRYWYSFPQTTEAMVEAGYAEVVRLWSPILDEFDRQGVRFALEVHPTEIAFDYYSAKRLVEAFGGRRTLGFNFDPSHLLWQGLDPALFLRDFADRVYHVHMKDVKLRRDGRAGILGSHLAFGDLRRGWDFVSIGHGDVDFDAIIRELNAAGYSGPLSVEWEDAGMDREHGARESLERVRAYDFAPSALAFDAAMRK
ncbi:MAG TPA: sugar phosphate isomerase/epimerase [Spirochaetales bacterium]|nr:sugar phosphate isomerase/epimerase [Spirochaetales bacterium]HRY55468.1 sugar phosphate isomerase/epimerase [Spirochaetia bacterium]HRZ63784.1 sugar phosphate isomerase/epimerase [Spirochaetia bacterium]